MTLTPRAQRLVTPAPSIKGERQAGRPSSLSMEAAPHGVMGMIVDSMKLLTAFSKDKKVASRSAELCQLMDGR